jgi:hypothetical protein
MMMMISAFWKPLLMFRITPVFDSLLCNECGYISAKGDQNLKWSTLNVVKDLLVWQGMSHGQIGSGG